MQVSLHKGIWITQGTLKNSSDCNWIVKTASDEVYFKDADVSSVGSYDGKTLNIYTHANN